jgi:hypothetical protein
MNPTAKTRRQWLRAAGGATLAIPFLPSLATLPRAYGAEPRVPRRKAFVAMCTHHGGISPANMYPTTTPGRRIELLPGHAIAHGPLAPSTEGGETVISQVLRAPSTRLTPRILSKMLVQRGLDIPFYLSHHWGGHMGNIAGNDGVAGHEQKAVQAFPNPTFDQVLAWSRATYPDLGVIRERSFTMGERFSYNWSSPSTRSGSIQPVAQNASASAWFDRIFGRLGGTSPAMTTAPSRKPLVDQVLVSYKRLRESNPRLSAADRRRLDDYMDRIAELQRKLSVAAPASCGNVKKPEGGSGSVERYRVFNEVMAASIMCGLTRVFVLSVSDRFINYQGDWHQGVAHTHDQSRLVPANRAAFQAVLLDLAHRLDVDAGDGSTYLDHSLLYWSQESGNVTHHSMQMPIVTLGSAGGAIKTGMFVDWRNMEARAVRIHNTSYQPGLLINRWWATLLTAFGLPSAEWEGRRNKGFGHIHVGGSMAAAYNKAHQDACSDRLPVVT